MGVTRITEWEAERIAERIAVKAMAHLIEPLDKEIDQFVFKCYEELVGRFIGAERVVEYISAGLVEERDLVVVDFYDGNKKRKATISSAGQNKLLLSPPGYSGWQIEDSALIEKYIDLTDACYPYIAKRNAMKKELKNQMTGKSAKHVMKTWPEATSFVALQFGIDVVTGKDVTMTTPLEQLLAKYLLALPAPKGE